MIICKYFKTFKLGFLDTAEGKCCKSWHGTFILWIRFYDFISKAFEEKQNCW